MISVYTHALVFTDTHLTSAGKYIKILADKSLNACRTFHLSWSCSCIIIRLNAQAINLTLGTPHTYLGLTVHFTLPSTWIIMVIAHI